MLGILCLELSRWPAAPQQHRYFLVLSGTLISVSVRQKEALQAYSQALQKNVGGQEPGEVSGPWCGPERGQLGAAAPGLVPLRSPAMEGRRHVPKLGSNVSAVVCFLNLPCQQRSVVTEITGVDLSLSQTFCHHVITSKKTLRNGS